MTEPPTHMLRLAGSKTEATTSQAVHARPVHLTPDTRTEDAFRIVVLECLAQISANVPAVRAGEVEGLHQLRVGLRRLRVALAAFGRGYRGGIVNALRKRIGNYADAVGLARDLDVFAEDLLAPAARRFEKSGNGFAQLRQSVQRARSAAWEETIARIGDSGFSDFLEEIARVAERRQESGSKRRPRKLTGRPILETALKSLDKRLKIARKRGRHIDSGDAHDFHRLRIALKKLRYTAEFFEPLFKHGRVKSYAKKLRKLQSVLGSLNDVAAAQAMLARLEIEPGNGMDLRYAGGAITGWHLSRKKRLQKSARAHWHKLARTRPFWE